MMKAWDHRRGAGHGIDEGKSVSTATLFREQLPRPHVHQTDVKDTGPAAAEALAGNRGGARRRSAFQI